MNDLEKFIRENRAEFDHMQPRQKLWERIESDLDQGKSDYTWIWKAAVVVLVAVCAYLISERNAPTAENANIASELVVDPEFVETELYYTQMIAEQRLILDQFDLDDPQLKENFKRDLASLDTMYQELKLEYVETSNEAVLEAMIGNLQLRMELLDQQLQILERIENEGKNESHHIENL